jgi:hypothetical protein
VVAFVVLSGRRIWVIELFRLQLISLAVVLARRFVARNE